ncbi:MAG: DNA/RNA nuclease SfsA [Bacteroidales bacterium]
MIFENKLVRGILIKRYKRFLADVMLCDGSVVTVHCTNSGSMKTCIEEGAEVYLSDINNPKRKTRYTWEMIKIGASWVGVNTLNANKVAYELIENRSIRGLDCYNYIKQEVKFEDSRFDIFAKNDKEQCFIEVKNVSMKDGDYAVFPDAVTARGQKHLQTLLRVKASGIRAVMLYIVQRSDVCKFAPASNIDPKYAELLGNVHRKGVEVYVAQTKVSPSGIFLKDMLDFQC